MTEPQVPVTPPTQDVEEAEESHIPSCPLCGQADFVRRLLFFTYCANPVHVHKSGEPPTNTVIEFRYCIEHGRPDACVQTVKGAPEATAS